MTTNSPTTAEDDVQLPVPAENDRPYLKIQPTADPLTAETVTAHLRKLHGLELQSADSWLDRFRSSPNPTIEWLLVSNGQDSTIEYYVGTDPPDALDALTPLCRGLFPDSYEITRVQWHSEQLTTDDREIAAVDFRERCDRPRDWQTQLTPFAAFQTDETARIPLATMAEAMANSSVPMVYQALVKPQPDRTGDAEVRQRELQTGTDTIGGKVVNALMGPPDEEDYSLTASDERRLEELAAKDLRHPFVVTARAFAVAEHESEAIQDRTVATVADRGLRSYVPGTKTRTEGIVADPTELGNFCLLDGAALPPDARRVLETVPASQTSVSRPPATVLEPYQQPGLVLGQPRTHDGTTTGPIALPPTLQARNVGWIGQTGAGKSTSLINALLENHRATDGPEILIDPKGGSMPREYLQSHYAEYGTLDDIIYFDCAEWLPAISFFDVQPECEAGVPRAVAVEDRVGHYQEVLRQYIGAEQYDRALRSTDIIENVLRAMYDPVHGRDAVTNRELHAALQRLHDRETPPAVSDPDLEARLESMVSNVNSRTFNDIMHGALNRVEKLSTPTHLNRVFNHRPSGIEADQATFDFADWLDEDVVIIVDTGRLRPAVKRGLTLVLLSNLWTALRRRRRRRPSADLPLVNLYLEEAASIANSQLLKRLLAQSRSFGCALTLAMQFPGQLEAADPDVYAELLNNVGTYVTSTVGVDYDLAHRFATQTMGNEAMANRLRGLSPGQWLVDLPAEFTERSPQPFMVESLPLPAGHPDYRDRGSAVRSGFEDAYKTRVDRIRAEYGLPVAQRATADTGASATADDVPTPRQSEQTSSATSEDDAPAGPVTDSTPEEPPSILAWTSRMPPFVRYEGDSDALVCTTCGSRYNPTADGMRTAIECCHSVSEIARDAVPICSCNVTLSPAEVEASTCSL